MNSECELLVAGLLFGWLYNLRIPEHGASAG